MNMSAFDKAWKLVKMGYVSPPLQPADDDDPYAICPDCGAKYSEEEMDHMDRFFEAREQGTKCWECGSSAADFQGKINDTVKICPECNEPEGDGSCSDCLMQQREEGRYEELWDE